MPCVGPTVFAHFAIDWTNRLDFTALRHRNAIANVAPMSQITSFRDLVAWQKSMELADVVYTLTERFPPREWFGLSYQMRKASVSIPSNIAEGHRRRRAAYRYHLEIALGSHGELETQSVLAANRKYIVGTDRTRLDALTAEVGRLVHGLFNSLPPLP